MNEEQSQYDTRTIKTADGPLYVTFTPQLSPDLSNKLAELTKLPLRRKAMARMLAVAALAWKVRIRAEAGDDAEFSLWWHGVCRELGLV